MVAAAADDGAVLECRSGAPTLPHLTSSDSTRLTVHSGSGGEEAGLWRLCSDDAGVEEVP
ncbi:hypothetical protein E2C01_081822 [Portunus trituberculatus]|uniref:Uncharacterized protein n=1 Tax=Portunus trituberculatus TaxID=210409 RepID=A0A5B7IZW7_PORTR|nr:hypothetical protein [Portunus trituberculatus]